MLIAKGGIQAAFPFLWTSDLVAMICAPRGLQFVSGNNGWYMRIFALGNSAAFGAGLAAALGRQLDLIEERDFEDGEHKIRPLVSVRGEDIVEYIYVFNSIYAH
jgi:hypothetical protein